MEMGGGERDPFAGGQRGSRHVQEALGALLVVAFGEGGTEVSAFFGSLSKRQREAELSGWAGRLEITAHHQLE
jgi:hypothetical protein